MDVKALVSCNNLDFVKSSEGEGTEMSLIVSLTKESEVYHTETVAIHNCIRQIS